MKTYNASNVKVFIGDKEVKFAKVDWSYWDPDKADRRRARYFTIGYFTVMGLAVAYALHFAWVQF